MTGLAVIAELGRDKACLASTECGITISIIHVIDRVLIHVHIR